MFLNLEYRYTILHGYGINYSVHLTAIFSRNIRIFLLTTCNIRLIHSNKGEIRSKGRLQCIIISTDISFNVVLLRFGTSSMSSNLNHPTTLPEVASFVSEISYREMAPLRLYICIHNLHEIN